MRTSIYHHLRFIPALLILSCTLFARNALADNPEVKMETTMGTAIIELYPDKAPVTVKNFLRYVNAGKYNGTIFHRVIKNFMNQGGGYTADFKEVPTYAPIKNEAYNSLRNLKYTIAMARTNDPNSATNQFFINTNDNAFLDFTSKLTPRGWGYTVFGKVIKGQEVMDKISRVRTTAKGPFSADAPVVNIVIKKMTEIKHQGSSK